jgi:hypothetical protein
MTERNGVRLAAPNAAGAKQEEERQPSQSDREHHNTVPETTTDGSLKSCRTF